MEYVITWVEATETREAIHDDARKAFAAAKDLIDAGKRRVEIVLPGTQSVVKGAAILEICDALEGRDTE